MLLNCNSVKKSIWVCLRITGLENYCIRLKSLRAASHSGSVRALVRSVKSLPVNWKLQDQKQRTCNRVLKSDKVRKWTFRDHCILGQLAIWDFEDSRIFQLQKIIFWIEKKFEVWNIELMNRTRYHKRKLNRIILDHLKSYGLYKAIQIHSFRTIQYDSRLGRPSY